MSVTFKTTPEEMITIANKIESEIEKWDASIKEMINLINEMNAMWEGDANHQFNIIIEEDIPKFSRLSTIMEEYRTAIINIANKYIETENNVIAQLNT